jgi:hydrogenase/urease accessory protein HupE
VSPLRSLLLLIALVCKVAAHEEPTSFLEFRIGNDGLSATFTASATDIAHDLPDVEAGMLLTQSVASAQGPAIAKSLGEQLTISADGKPLAAELRAITPVPEKRDLRLEFFFPWTNAPETVGVKSRIFSYDPRHRTFLSVHENGKLERQEILHRYSSSIDFKTGSTQSAGAVVVQFVASGIHHIFIGPDHILFVVGLLLLGGTVVRLLKVITAFTVAHSITLGLATFGILTPPASIIEPVIALSIVFVGIHAFLDRKGHDPRLLFAFGFGLIHGFGFANVLQEMVLPRAALGWSLFAFNAGVEIGQLCIVATVAPMLALIQHWSKPVAARVVSTAALVITAAGAFWFFQRVL